MKIVGSLVLLMAGSMITITPTYGAQAGSPSTDGNITLERIVTLGADGSGPLLGLQTRVVAASNGYYFAAPTYDPGVIAVYNQEGRFVRSIGGPGDGPGEFREIIDIAMTEGDTLIVTDVSQFISAFDPDLDHVGTFRADIPGPLSDPTGVPGMGFVVQVGFGLDPAMPDPLVVMTPGGEFSRAFPAPDTPDPDRGRWRIGLASRGLWLAKQSEYKLMLVDHEGNRLASTFRDDLEWFGPPGSPGEMRQGSITSVGESDGRVFVLGLRSQPDPALAGLAGLSEAQVRERLAELAGGRAGTLSDRLQRTVMFIDVYDAGTLDLVHSQFFPGQWLSRVLPEGRITVMRETDELEIVLDVMRMILDD